MRTEISKLAVAVAGVALLAGAYSAPAAAATQTPVVHHPHHSAYSHDIVVHKHAMPAPVAAAPDAFHGPAVVITAPVEIAGAIVSVPFRVVGYVFPPQAPDPRIVVGAPVHFAGQVAEFPFYAVNSAFGVQPTLYTY